MAPWERPRPLPVARSGVERLLTLASMAALLEPGLLRAIRLAWRHEGLTLADELALVRHPGVQACDLGAVVFDRDVRQQYRERFATLPQADQQRLASLLARWHAAVPGEVAVAESLAQQEAGMAVDAFGEQSRGFARTLAAHLDPRQPWSVQTESWRVWGRRITQALPQAIRGDAALREALSELRRHARPDRPPGQAAPPAPRRLTLVQAGTEDGGAGPPPFVLRTREGPARRGESPLGEIVIAERVQILDARRTDRRRSRSAAELAAGVAVDRGEGGTMAAAHRPSGAGVGAVDASRLGGRGRPRWAWPLGGPRGGGRAPADAVGSAGALPPRLAAVGVGALPRPRGSAALGEPHPRLLARRHAGDAGAVGGSDGWWAAECLRGARAARRARRLGAGPSVLRGPSSERAGPASAPAHRGGVGVRSPRGNAVGPRGAETSAKARPPCVSSTTSPGTGENSDGQTHPVAEKAPNPWGLYDMLGNVFEWCEDATDWPPSYSAEAMTDPLSTRGTGRVVRGGGWYDSARFVRAAYRSADEPGNRYHDLGFRLAGGPWPGGGAPEAGDRPASPEARDAPEGQS